MNRFNQLFEKPGRRALIPFFMLGDPDPETSLRIIRAALSAGADALELGIPFSDPVADGPTIQRSAQRALAAGTTVEKCLDLVERLRSESEVPIGLLMYYNLIYRHGVDRFCARMARIGADAVLAGDAPLEELDELERALHDHNLGCIQMVAPNTPLDRAATLIERSTAFTYVVSVMGTTGARDHLTRDSRIRVEQLRKFGSKPLVVGFGISQADQVERLYEAGADGVIVGSALIGRLEKQLNNTDTMVEEAGRFIAALRR